MSQSLTVFNKTEKIREITCVNRKKNAYESINKFQNTHSYL